jgi:xanthine dehydrogenase YagT iron-sulfur-binding subunit
MDHFSRRDFVGIAAGSVALAGRAQSQTPLNAGTNPSDTTFLCQLKVNGRAYSVEADSRTTLLDLLRENLQLSGTKKGCDHGQCGACTVLVNGRRINSCLSLAIMNDGAQVTTIEGLAAGAELHPMQTAFVEHDALQCGYCTPGQICSAVAMLNEIRQGAPSAVTSLSQPGEAAITDEEIRERMSGNICRCGAYVGIVAAIRSVAEGKNA